MKKQSFLRCGLKKFLISTSLLISLDSISYAGSPTLNEFNQFFNVGQYSKAVIALEKTSENEFVAGQRAYLLGICYSKLQEFDKSIKSFEMAIKNNNKNPDLQYEYGQALYAANELKAARRAFIESAAHQFNTPASLYYVAYISQLLEEYNEAKNNYLSLIKNSGPDNKILQLASFQLAETTLLLMREKSNNKSELEKIVEKSIIPMFKTAYEIDKSTSVANDIDQRLHEIQKEFNLDPDLLANGKRISSKRYSGHISQKIKFDDNISLTNEENNIQQSEKESFIFESEAYAKYDYVYKKKFIISPELRLNFIQHSDQDTPEVYQNDSFGINANIKNKYEHILFDRPASFLFDIETGKTLKDWKQTHKREAYSTTLNFGIGESFSYFKSGDTSVKLKRKKFNGENESISNNTTSLSADQTVSFSNQHLLIALLEADIIDNFNNTSTSTNTYLARFDYLIPEIMPKYTLGLALATTITDTKEQKASRGTEYSLNPSIDLSKEISDKMKLSINYDYTKSKSKSSDYNYKKSVFSTEFRYSF
jgi:tetratricopeptide (TPR) repeat protein